MELLKSKLNSKLLNHISLFNSLDQLLEDETHDLLILLKELVLNDHLISKFINFQLILSQFLDFSNSIF